MAIITLISTPLTRKMTFDTLDRLGVNIDAPVFKTKYHIIGWRVDALPKHKGLNNVDFNKTRR